MTRRPRSSRRWVTLLVAGTSLLCAAPAVAASACPDWTRAPAWSTSTVVSSVPGQSEDPRLAVRGDGAAVLAWNAPGARVTVARRAAGARAFGAPVGLAHGTRADLARGTVITTGWANGRAVVVTAGRRHTLVVHTAIPGGWRRTSFSFSSDSNSLGNGVAFAASADRPGLLAFGGTSVLEVVDLLPHATIGTGLPGDDSALAAAVAPGGGEALLLRRTAAGGGAELAVLPRSGTAFGAGAVLPADSQAAVGAWMSRTAGGASSVALAAWNLLPGAASRMRFFNVDPAGAVTTGVDDPLDGLNAAASADAAGGMLAAWVRPGSGGSWTIAAADHPAGAAWSGPRAILRTRWRPHWPAVVRLADGRAAVAVATRCGGRTGILVLRRSRGGTWAGPEVAASWPGYLTQPQLGTDAGGRLTVAWPRRLTAGGGYRSIPIEVATRAPLR